MRRILPVWLPLAAFTALACAAHDTSPLPAGVAERLAAESVLFRVDNVVFRQTRSAATSGPGWRDRRESIIVTRLSVLVHDGDYMDLEITPRSRRFFEVHRDGDRVRINAGSGRSAEVWSFVPPDSAEAWTRAIRTVIRNSNSSANPK